MSLRKKTLQGVFWNYVSFASGKLLAFVSTIVLAWLGLEPGQFGQVAIALLVVTYLDAIGDLGVASALIYQRDDTERASHVAFIISITTGLALWIVAAAAAPIIAAYFQEPAVVPMLRVLAFTMLIQSFGNVHMALLSKELEFRRRLLPDLARNSLKGFGAIFLALLGFGPWSLVWGQVLGALAGTVALWVVQPWRPRFVWSTALGRRMLEYGTQILLIELLSVVWATTDYILVGRYLGKVDLGLYQMAFRISDLLIINICWVAGRVLFSSYAQLNDNMEAVRRGYLVTLRYITLVTLPISFGLFAIAPVFVSLFLGAQWLAMIPALQWLALRAGIATISFNAGHVMKAIGQPGVVNRQLVVKIVIAIVMVWLTLPFGFVGVAMGQVGIASFSVLMELGVVRYILKVPATAIWNAVRPSLLSAACMGIAVWAFVSLPVQGWDFLRLIGAIVVGVVCYSLALSLIERSLLLTAVKSLTQALRPNRSITAES